MSISHECHSEEDKYRALKQISNIDDDKTIDLELDEHAEELFGLFIEQNYMTDVVLLIKNIKLWINTV